MPLSTLSEINFLKEIFLETFQELDLTIPTPKK